MTAATLTLSATRRLDFIDSVLVILFLAGLYLGVSLQITSTIPLTCAPSGVAGLLMLWRRRDQINPRHFAGLLAVVTVYLFSILAATNYAFLNKRFTGLLQLTYSLVIAYAMFLTMVHGERRQIANILLGFCIFIILGCLLETYAGLRPISNAVRGKLYDVSIIYDADLRDMLLYGRIRPKLFTSEPSAVTFSYTQYSALWLVLSTWRWKLPVFFCMMAMALFVLPGPTLVLMLLLTVPYLIFLAGMQPGRRPSASRLIGSLALSVFLVAMMIALGQIFFAARLDQLARGEDASFFGRFTGPMLVAFDMLQNYAWAGAGLTGETFIADRVMNVYMNSPAFDSSWRIARVADALSNYFWLHWIYLGAVWGVVCIVAVSVWLRMLGVPSVLYCWVVWVILGQASGSYVGPKAWSVLLMAAAASVRPSAPAATVLLRRRGLRRPPCARNGGSSTPGRNVSDHYPS
jgi:hypothetical protein